jgi:hypothetical protein
MQLNVVCNLSYATTQIFNVRKGWGIKEIESKQGASQIWSWTKNNNNENHKQKNQALL